MATSPFDIGGVSQSASFSAPTWINNYELAESSPDPFTIKDLKEYMNEHTHHLNPSVQTYYNAMKNIWEIVGFCCGVKYKACITAEYLYDAFQDGKDLRWEFYNLFRDFIVKHPYMRSIFYRLSRGSFEASYGNGILDGPSGIQWQPGNWAPMDDQERKYWENVLKDDKFTAEDEKHFYSAIQVTYTTTSKQFESGYIVDGGGSLEGYGADPGVKQLPALAQIVKHPVTKNEQTLRSCIINLNDGHGWTREQVADWLETLDIDIRFKTGGNHDED